MLVEVLLCEIDGRVLRGMQFRVLVEVPLCETDGRVLGGMQAGACVKGADGQRGRHSVWGAV